VPPGIFSLEPYGSTSLKTLFSLLVHRILTAITFVSIILYWIKVKKTDISKRVKKGTNALLHTATLQFVLGIATLIFYVPISLAAAHQATALLLLTVALYLCHAHTRGQ
jgi:Uncharacterized protein required for cytochrome oxidase assembly